MATLLLIHGGIWEHYYRGTRFWRTPGVAARLEGEGRTVLVPDRPRHPADWQSEAEHLAGRLPGRPCTVVAGSNGCSVAVRLAVTFPHRVHRLLLAWPATAGDPVIDAAARASLAGAGTPPAVIDQLLAGTTLRGVDDAELATLPMPVGVLPSEPENPIHSRPTVDALLDLIPGATELPGCPEPPHPSFRGHLEAFARTVLHFAADQPRATP